LRKAKDVKKYSAKGKYKPEKSKGAVKCGCGFRSMDGKDLVEHYRNCHPRVSRQGFQGDMNSIADEKLKRLIIRLKKKW
jgi:hypothetical protein